MTGKLSACLRFVLVVTVISELGAFQVEADYDNHWAFYYESPCCGHHHLRHHKDHVREFTCGKLYYRTFYLDEKRDALYVGAMDRVFRLNLSNISHSNCE
ncbi:semaphorin-2A-like, partial [Cryptotermes secundus]|uniref:semaphorin-2A-like n=1 Tax=Cryptotermes secundus TaxID=105785 RepID=UPI000CD7D8C3